MDIICNMCENHRLVQITGGVFVWCDQYSKWIVSDEVGFCAGFEKSKRAMQIIKVIDLDKII